MTHYNLTAVENATTFNTLWSGVNDLTGGLYINTFLALLWVIVFVAVQGEAPVKAVVASFVTLIVSVGLFFGGVVAEGVIVVCASALFLSLLWKINS